MSGTNLTRDEAQTRARLLDVGSYTIELDLTTSDKTFASTTTIEFGCAQPGAETFAEIVDATFSEITLNGRSLDPDEVYADTRIRLTDLAETNTLVVRAELPYSNSGQGLHRAVDPEDGRVYLYTQFEVPDATRVYAAFDQPDLKSRFTFKVTAPSDWKVISNTPTPEPVALDDGAARWDFPQTKVIPTYITAVCAGHYYEVRETYEGPHGTYELGHFCRQSMKDGLDHEWIGKITKAGFELYEDVFGPYPFEKYDQVWVPEYNMGGMENAGCVTINDDYLPKNELAPHIMEYRAGLFLHELAHMWFGNLVTMRWWDDLWLNEAFAEWCDYWAMEKVTEFPEAWAGFSNGRRQRGMRADQMPTTHPIASDIVDVAAIETNFDMVTYAKGASVIKQLAALVGEEDFLRGVRNYFGKHAYANAEFDDLLSALEEVSGRDLRTWAHEWLQTASVNTLSPAFEVDGEGRYTSFAVEQTAPPEHPTLRQHRISLGLYDVEDDRLVLRTRIPAEIDGERTEIAEVVGQPRAALVLVDDQDVTWSRIRLDEESLETLCAHLGELPDPHSRAAAWASLWDQVRAGEFPASRYADVVLAHIASETDAYGVGRVPAYASMAVRYMTDPARRPEVAARWESGLRELLFSATEGVHQQSFLEAYAASARSDAAIADLEGLLDGTVKIDGLHLDQAKRWTLLGGLARAGRAGTRIDDELARDSSLFAQEAAAGARASQPDAEGKAEAWRRTAEDPTTSTSVRKTIAKSFVVGDQIDLVAPYLDKWFEVADTLVGRLGAHMARAVLEFMFPRNQVSQETLDRIDAWLETATNPHAIRYALEARADVAGNLAAQRRDAQG